MLANLAIDFFLRPKLRLWKCAHSQEKALHRPNNLHTINKVCPITKLAKGRGLLCLRLLQTKLKLTIDLLTSPLDSFLLPVSALQEMKSRQPLGSFDV
jgi:hypothetical protein